jgi:hypothetical protein
MTVDLTPLTIGSTLGIAFGIALLAKGMTGQRRAARIGDTSTSTISALAVGEVRISGVVEPAEILLTSPLQSRDCVYYRSRVSQAEGRSERTVFDEERAVGFRVRDASGDVRVFPRAADWLVPDAFSAGTGLLGDEPTGLRLRAGSAIQPGIVDRATQIADLLTVHDPSGLGDPGGDVLDGHTGGRRDYREARIEPGDVVTIIGTVLPFDQLEDASGADAVTRIGLDTIGDIADPEIAADLEEARAAGTLETDPSEAWGNAAIPGFGVGRPTRPPELDGGAAPLPIASQAEADRIGRTFEIAPETLIVAAAPDASLLVSLGEPGAAVARQEDRFFVGLLGAILAIASAVVLATALSRGIIL